MKKQGVLKSEEEKEKMEIENADSSVMLQSFQWLNATKEYSLGIKDITER